MPLKILPKMDKKYTLNTIHYETAAIGVFSFFFFNFFKIPSSSIIMLNLSLFSFSFEYKPPKKSVHVQLLGVGVCPKCWKSRKVVKDFMGNIKSVSDCQFCEKAELSRDELSIWVLCGAAGSGKTSLFNALTGFNTPVSDSAETKTLNKDAIAYCLEPLPSCFENQSHLLFVDSEGTNGEYLRKPKMLALQGI